MRKAHFIFALLKRLFRFVPQNSPLLSFSAAAC